jgi:hypothetical protein
MVIDNEFINVLAWIIGGVIVVVFSWNFYNQESYYLDNGDKGGDRLNSSIAFLAPVLPRYASSRIVYIGWFVAFLAFTLSIYLLAAIFLSQPTMDMEQILLDEIVENAGLMSILFVAYKQLLAAFIVTGMNNVVPRKFDILTHLRKFAHSQAKIPEEARAVYKRISSADLRLTEDQKKMAIEFIGKDFLAVQDFDARPGTIERNWGTICHLLAETSRLTKDLGSLYSTNLHNPKLRYDSIMNNLETLKAEIRNRRLHQEMEKDYLLVEVVSQFLKQVTHLVVCLVFLSEPSRKAVFTRWQKIGVSLRIRPKFKVNGSAMFTAVTIFSTAVAVVAFSLGVFLRPSSQSDVIDVSYALNTAVGTLLVICVPMLIPMFIKWVFSDYWPVRGQFSNDRRTALYLFFFFVGSLAGVFGLYATSLFGFMNESWPNYRPYVLLSGSASLLMAFCLDRHPKIMRQIEILKRAIPYLFIGTLMFLLLGIIAKVWSEQIAARELDLSALLAEEIYLFILLAAIGAMVGFVSSYLADHCLKIKSEREEIGLNLSEYFLPVIGFHDFHEMEKQNIDELIETNLAKLPKEFIRYLEEKGVLSNSKLTDDGYNLIAAPHFNLSD